MTGLNNDITMSNTKSVRSSNLELFRIVLMLAIVAHHYTVNSGLFTELNNAPFADKSLFYYLFGMWGKTGINCFVLITGYFMCKKDITLVKFLRLLLEVEFYNILFYLVFVFTGYSDFSAKHFFFAIFPIGSVRRGFVSCFLLFYLCIPFLNILIKNITLRQHRYLILLCLFIYTFLGMIPLIKVEMNYVSWFCVIYFIASYIRKHEEFNEKPMVIRGRYFLAVCVLSMLSVVGCVFLKKICLIDVHPYWFMSDSYAILAVVTSICAFLYFKGLKIPTNKIINTVASSIFGVLLIHANSDNMRQWLWKDTLNVVEQYYSNYSILLAVLTVLGVFVACTIIDQLRIFVFEKPLFRWIGKRL